MRISARSDYALRGMAALAADQSSPITCDAIALAQGIPARYLKSVFVDLRRAGLVRSQRGCEGGYWIGRDAGSISVGDVIRAVDGEFPTLHAEPVQTDDQAWGAWSAVADLLNALLDNITLIDVVNGSAPPAVRAALSTLRSNSSVAV